MKYYLVGIKGSGMAGLASMLNDLGHEIIGSDLEEDFGFESGIKKRNIKILPFNFKNITSEYIYIISNAYKENHEEVREIKDKGYKYYYYHEFIASLKGIHIAVSGTHGKTTTTKMIVDLLKGEKIAYIIGDGTGGAVKDYKYLIYEACEYQDHFLSYKPDILVVNKVELDHPDYFNSIEQVYSSFNKLISQSKNVITKNNNNLKKKANFTTFGIDKGDYQVRILEENNKGFKIEINNTKLNIPFYGYHMVDNFVSAYLVLKKLGYHDTYIENKIKDIELPKRRLEEEKFKNQLIVQDYAHHPTEIKAVYDSLRQKYPKTEMVVFFQPHTYSRTLSLSSSFNKALDCFDKVYVFPTFSSAREKKNNILQKQVDEIFKRYINVKSFEEVIIDNKAKIYLFLGAGSIGSYIAKLKMKIMKIINEND